MATGHDDSGSGERKQATDYKLVVLRADDLQEVRSFQLSVSNLYVILSVALLVIGFSVFALLAFTPLRNFVPGYGKIKANEEFLSLVTHVDDIDQSLDAQELYLGALQGLILPATDSIRRANLPTLSDTSNTGEILTSYRPPLPPANRYPPPAIDLIQSDIQPDLWEAINAQKILAPIDGVVSAGFDPAIKHFGIDILAPANTPVRAMMDGYVFSSGWNLETGHTIGVQHANQILSFYKHNSYLLKEKGTFVKAGEAVAVIGNTGTLSNGPHLHFECWHNGKPINPEDIIKF